MDAIPLLQHYGNACRNTSAIDRDTVGGVHIHDLDSIVRDLQSRMLTADTFDARKTDIASF